VAGEDPPGAVAAVGGRSQAQDQQTGGGIAEARNRSPPVILVRVCGPLYPRYLLAPGHQPRTAAAADDLLLGALQRLDLGHLAQLGLQRASVLTLVVLAIRPRADRLPPPAVLAVPLRGAGQPRVEAHLGLPPQRLELLRGQRVAA